MGILHSSALDRPIFSAVTFGAVLTVAGFSHPSTVETPNLVPLTVDGLDRPLPESVPPELRFRCSQKFETELDGAQYDESATNRGFVLCVEPPGITNLDVRTSLVLPTTHETTASVRLPVREFIKRVIVPILVQRFVEGQNRGTLPPCTGEAS